MSDILKTIEKVKEIEKAAEDLNELCRDLRDFNSEAQIRYTLIEIGLTCYEKIKEQQRRLRQSDAYIKYLEKTQDLQKRKRHLTEDVSSSDESTDDDAKEAIVVKVINNTNNLPIATALPLKKRKTVGI